MARIEGPNGLVYEVEDRVAAGLVGKGNRGYSYVEDEKKSAKSTAKKSSSKKPSSKK